MGAFTKKFMDTHLYKKTLIVLIQQNVIVLQTGTSLKGSSLTSQKLTILTQN